jgi:hypothetical protein
VCRAARVEGRTPTPPQGDRSSVSATSPLAAEPAIRFPRSQAPKACPPVDTRRAGVVRGRSWVDFRPPSQGDRSSMRSGRDAWSVSCGAGRGSNPDTSPGGQVFRLSHQPPLAAEPAIRFPRSKQPVPLLPRESDTPEPEQGGIHEWVGGSLLPEPRPCQTEARPGKSSGSHGTPNQWQVLETGLGAGASWAPRWSRLNSALLRPPGSRTST